MTIKVTFNFDSVSDAAEFLARNATGSTVSDIRDVEQPTKPSEPRPFEKEPLPFYPDPDAKEVAIQSVESPKKTRAKKKAAAVPPVAVESAPTLDDVRAALTELSKTKGLPACADALARAGITRIGELSPQDYSQFISSCRA